VAPSVHRRDEPFGRRPAFPDFQLEVTAWVFTSAEVGTTVEEICCHHRGEKSVALTKKDRPPAQCRCQMLTRRLEMAITQRIGWALIGAVIGGIGVSTLTAGQLPPERPERRLIVLRNAGPMEGASAYFIKDAKTGACWLTVRFRDDSGGSLAPAPAVSCEQ
jgi:hypothetical protein